MNYFNLNDVPFEIIGIGETLWESETGFQNFLEDQGIRDTREVSEEKWATVMEAIQKLENND